MVSTLHITLTNNQPSPSPQWLGRSASCEETNLLGISSTLTATSKTTSLSTSSVLRPQAPGAGVLGLPSSTHNLVAPTPYSPSVSSKAQSWSPVRLKTKPLPDFLKRLNQESVHAGSPGAPQAKDARCRAAAPQGAGRPSSTTSTVEGQVPATLAARWSPAASGDSSKPKLSPRADRKVLGIPISSVAVSSASEAAPFNAARGKAASATQGHWRSLSDGSPSRSRREVSPATINDPLLKPAAGSTAVPQEACPRIQDVSPSASGQLGDTQDSGRRASLGSASKESPTAPRKQLLGDTAWFSPSSRSATMPALRTAASAPWQQRPNRLSSASLQRFEDSVHSGGGREGVGGGVMEDGGRHTRVAPTSSAHRKANSLPGYSRGGSNLQPSFREAFNTSKSPTPPSRTNDAPAAPPRGPTSPRAATKAVGVPSVLPQQQRHKQKQQHQQQQHQQKQQHPQQQQQQKQNQQQSSNNLQQYQKQHQQQLQQQLRQKQMEQQLQQQQLWQQHQQQQRMHETYRQNAQQQGKSQRQPKLPQHGLAPPVSQDRQPPPSQEPSPPKPVPSTPEKKSKISILSGIFRRRKKGSSNSSSSSVSSTDSEEPPQRRSFLRRRSKKKERKDPLPPPPPIPPAEERLGRTFGDFHDGNNLRRPGDSSYRRVRVVPAGTGSLGKETQPLGIPMLAPQPGKLNRLGVSASHDSLPLSLGSWTGGGSHASLGYHSGGGMGTRSSSTDTISKKERREALKARVERLRDRTRDTSSDDEKASVSSHSMYGSESSLSKNGSISRRSRAARTERFLRRKSHELETLRNETEKDRRNREAVQARIEEIQRVREFEAKRNKLNEERKSQSVPKTKSRWCAKLVYQESSEYESSVLLRTPSVSPVASPHMKAKLNGHAKDGVVLRNKPVSSSVAVSLAVPSVTPSRRSFQDHDSPVHNTLRGHRSASYDSNINRNSFVMQQSAGPAPSGVPRTNRSGLIPPTPPPRDKSRILSPGDGRPMSFSFESLNQEAQRSNSSQSSMSNFTKGSSPSPSVRSVPAYLGPRSNTQAPGPSPMLLPSRRSFSELELSQQQQTQAKSGFPASPSRPAPPGYPNSHYTYTDEPPRPAPQNHYYRPQHQQQPNEQMQYYTDESPQHTKIVPISSVPASPSSDYSSYMSDNSIRLQQANTAWRQKEQEIKNKISVSPSTAPPAISDSSPCNSPKPENGAASSPVRQMQQQDEGIYATIETKKSRPAPITLNQAESFSSLSGQSDVSSPPPRGPDSDSSQGSLARDKKKLAQNRPLSMVLEKVECGEKETPPTTPKGRPQPPVRGTWQSATSGREITNRKKFEEIVKHKVDVKAEKSISQKEVEDMFKKEKEKLQSSKCSNFEEALKELEEIYASLRLDSEDLLDGAERRDLPVQHQEMWAKKAKKYNDQKDVVSEGDSLLKDSGRTRSLSGRRSGVPDVKGDDMHFRRCQQSTRNQPDVQKALQMTGSYLLVSPAHVTPSELDQDLPKDPMMLGEPDVVYDDVLYRNIKQANSIKVIDPQPPFGIPLGPTTQASSSDYLHVTPKENYRPTMTTRKQPDITMDDLAFRNLRRDKGNKEVNTSELDELLCEARTGSPRRRTVRSASADRAQSKRGDRDRELKHHTSRQGRHQNDTQRVGGRTDSEAMAGLNSVSSRHNPSWLERAHLVDPKWDMSTNNLSTSTETLTELSSTRAVSQPDIRQAIIREARGSKGGPLELAGGGLHHITATSLATPIPVTLATITVPRLVKVHTAHSAPASPVILEAMPYKPLDSIFNNKAKPFYLGNADTDQQDDKQEDQEQLHKEKQQQQQPKQQQQEPVDIAKLDALISTLSKIDANEVSDSSDTSSKRRPLNHPPTKTAMKELKISELALENVPEPQTVASGHSRKSSVDYEYNSAKANVKKAIRLSMALESYNSEGERDEEESNPTHHHHHHRHHNQHTEKSRSPVKEGRKSEAEKKKEERRRNEEDKQREKRREREKKSEAETVKERERRARRLEHGRLRIDEREKRRSSREKTPGGEKKRAAPEEDKRKSWDDKERREKRRIIERVNRRSGEKEKRHSKEKSTSPEKRDREETKKRREKSLEKGNVNRTSVSLEKKISTSSSTSSTSGGNSRMVQQKGSSNVEGDEGAQGRAEVERRERIQRYKDERRKQMAARYGHAEGSSSEESGGGDETYSAYRRRRRRGGKDTNTSSNTDLSTHEASRVVENGSPPECRGRRMVGGSSSEDVVVSAGVGVKSTRTSRLRLAARASSSSSTTNNNNNNNNNNTGSSNNNNNIIYSASPSEGVGERGRGEASPDLAPLKRLPDQAEGRMCVDSADSTLSGSDGRGGRRHAGGSDKDKSHKRKSHLNRCTTSEVLPPSPDALPAITPNDSGEDTPVRRRRRGPLSPVGGGGGGLSVSAAEPLKTPEVVRHVVSRLTPPITEPTQPSTLCTSQQPSAPAHTFQPIQPAAVPDSTHSAPSTLDSRSRHAQDGDRRPSEGRRLSGSLGYEAEEGVRKVPPKLAPLRKPDIPDVLRPKDTTGLASPGVVNTPPASRPSSVVFEKPPLAPEGQRPVTLRTSLRKPTDIGTCFMATRREKRDDTKPENVFRDQLQRPKKGDRLSKSDMNLKLESSYSGKQDDLLSPGSSDLEIAGNSASPTTTPCATSSTEEVMSSRLEALTTRAKETMERADRLGKDSTPPPPESSPPEDSADNMVHECEQYLTVNAGRKERSGGVRPREIVSSDTRSDKAQSPTVKKGVISDTGQKNWGGGSEGRGKESKRLAMEKEVNKEVKREPSQAAGPVKMSAASAVPSGPPDHASFGSDSLSPPPEEVVHGLRHVGYADEEVGSPESVQIRSPDYRSSSSNSGSKRSSRRCSLEGDTPQAVSPDPQSILKRRSSREDVTVERPTTPEPHSILKRKTSSRTSSIDMAEGEPRPILKKKSSIEELDHFEPRPILKKKSSTDDELDDRPRSILKGGRSREDLDLTEGFISPNPILKRSPRCDSEEGEGELRPILKRRDTTDGVRLRLNVSDGEDVEDEVPSVRVRSDSAPEAVIRLRGHSPPAMTATPSHGILKKRGAHSPGRLDQMDSELGAILRSRRSQGVSDADSDIEATNRPQSPSLIALTRREEASSRSNERPLSVAERVAGMEAAKQEPPRQEPPRQEPPRQEPPASQRSPTPTRSPGARPKLTPSFLDRPTTLTDKGRDNRRNSAFGLVAGSSPGDGAEAINEAFLERPVVEAFNSAMLPLPPSGDEAPTTPSLVSQKAAFFAQLERERKISPDSSPARPVHTSRFSSRRDRGARHATQPVTEDEVNQAARLAEASDSASHDSDSAPPRREASTGFRAAREAMLRNSAEVLQGLTPGSSPRRRPNSRKTSVNEPEDDSSLDPVRGILKRDGSGGSREVPRESPRSILKHFSDSRRASFSESEHPRGILKSESPLPPPIGSPEHEAKLLRGVLKKDSSLEDSKEIKSILKPESQSLERDHSSDSSSDDVTLTTGNTTQGPECDIADSIRDIDPVRHKDDPYKNDLPYKVDPFKAEHHLADMADALRQVEPIKSRDDLGEALRQIEPIHYKERSREREDRGREENHISVREYSSSSKITSSMVATASMTSQASAITNSSSSTSENELKVIKNEAVMRRKANHSRKYDERRSMVEMRSIERTTTDGSSSLAHHDASESESSSSSDSSEGQLKTSLTTTNTHFRSSYTSSDMDASHILRQSPIFRNKTSSSSPEQEKKTGRSTSPSSQTINARLACLQKSGEDGWKNRVKKDTKDVNSNVTLRPKPAGGHKERPVSLMDRMSALASSSQQWKGRVPQSDATKFTVAHKMASASTSSVPSLIGGISPAITITPELVVTPTGSPLLERKKRSPCQKIFKSRTGGNIPSLINRSSPSNIRKSFRRSISTPHNGEKKAEAPEGTSVSVPQVDDDSFNAFFSKVPDSPSRTSDDAPLLNEADLDHISVTASQLVVKRRSVRVTRRQVASRNPLKALAAREDIKSEYMEVKMGTGEKELRRMKVEELSKSSTMAVEALAGLASKENFSAVALKKVENSPVTREMPPYTSLMLLHVKGRRHAQTRLVEPVVSNVNQGDDFVLITPSEIYHYKGEFANVIERAKASEIAQYVLQKKDMGVTSVNNVVEVDEHSPSTRRSKFWRLLGGDERSEGQPAGAPDEDECVEAALVAANKVYEVQEDSLVPLPDSWGQMPKIEILSSEKVLVMDFGSELYIWAGKRGCGDERRLGVALGRELWEEEYDYSECDINPIMPMMPVSQAKLTGSRPAWGLCAKLTENVETILFKEKFIDWPDLAQQSRIKEVKKELDRYVAPVSELQPCDAKMLLEELPLEPDLELEMTHLGRGVEYYDEEERRLLTISTNDFKVWHVSEYGKVQMSEASRSHLYTGDSYVVRWYYHVTASGRTLKGEPSKHNVTGRSRVAYFFWQGKDSSVSDKGVSALMTVELDEERGPHIRVSMGLEPPAFLNLFKGGLIIHQGRQDDEHEPKPWKLFIVRGELENEGHLVEVDVDSSHLRSRGCLVLVNCNTGVIHLWLGAKALKGTREVGTTTAQRLMDTSESDIGWKSTAAKKIKKQYEGAESRDFWEGFGGSKNNHFSLLDDDHTYDWTPRIWHMEAKHDSFQATEMMCSYRATSIPNPLAVMQSDLYSAKQPALFMVDSGHQVWVWQGWWPDESSDGDEFSATGSAVLRFNFARRAALETALNYCQIKAKSQAKSLAAKSYKRIEVEAAAVEPQLVVAGMEPLEFTNVFPWWTPKPDVIAIQEKEGRWAAGGQHLVTDILAQLSRTQYSLAELTMKTLPDGADPLHLEVYLSPEEFTEALGMNQDEFYSLQTWRQTEIKKKANLF